MTQICLPVLSIWSLFDLFWLELSVLLLFKYCFVLKSRKVTSEKLELASTNAMLGTFESSFSNKKPATYRVVFKNVIFKGWGTGVQQGLNRGSSVFLCHFGDFRGIFQNHPVVNTGYF